MEKRYADAAIFYAAAAMVFGVFYREFTKFNGFTGKTNLSVMHTHYFLLGMFFFLILMLLEKNFRFSGGEKIGIILTVYHIGLNVTRFSFKGSDTGMGYRTQQGDGCFHIGPFRCGPYYAGNQHDSVVAEDQKKDGLRKKVTRKKRKRPVNADGTAVYRICLSCIYRPFLNAALQTAQLFIAQQQADDTAEDSCDRINDGCGPEHIK